MAQPNRETARDALTTLLNTELVTTNATVQQTYNYRPSTFDGKSPVVCVSSAGSNRERGTFAGARSNLFRYTIYIFVLYAATGWTEANAEDRLDAIEQGVADVINDNPQTANWNAIDYAGDSVRRDVVVGGADYIMEAIPIEVEAPFG